MDLARVGERGERVVRLVVLLEADLLAFEQHEVALLVVPHGQPTGPPLGNDGLFELSGLLVVLALLAVAVPLLIVV